MNDHDCTATRRALMAGDALGALEEAHVNACAPCAAFAARLHTVDDALDADARDAEAATLPDSLRARILAAAKPASAPAAASSSPPSSPGGRLLDLGLRFTAAAAVLVAAALAMPGTAMASELELPAMDALRTRISAAFAEGPRVELPEIGREFGRSVPLPEPSSPLPLAAGAVVLVAAGIVTLRKDSR